MTPLQEALQATASSRVVLVASDYDGTLAPIVADPDLAHPDERAIAALVALGELPDTYAAILSGRDAAVLQRLTLDPAGVELVGSHGAEQAGRPPDVERAVRKYLDMAQAQLTALTTDFPGSHLEQKPAGIAFHYRNVRPALRQEAEAAARKVGQSFPSLTTLLGKRVVELAGSRVNKGDALRVLRDRCDASAVVFIGDDVTDEDAFAALRAEDLGIKVGAGATAAGFRVEDQSAVAGILESFFAYRGQKVT